MLVFLQAIFDLYLPSLMADIVDVGIVNGDIDYITRVGGWMLLMAALAVICAVIASFLSSRTATGFGRIFVERYLRRWKVFLLRNLMILALLLL